MDYKRMNEFRLLGLTIAYYRKLRGLTQAELAEATNLSRTHISNIEAPNGKTSISLNKLFDIAEVLEVPVKVLSDPVTVNEEQSGGKPLHKKCEKVQLC